MARDDLIDCGLTVRGVLIRHLVMPGGLEETRQILDWIAHKPRRQSSSPKCGNQLDTTACRPVLHADQAMRT